MHIGLAILFKNKMAYTRKLIEPKVIQVRRFFLDNVRLSLKQRYYLDSQKYDISLKANSAALGEILANLPHIETKYDIEQDIYGRFTKFSLKFKRKGGGYREIITVKDVKKLFPGNYLLRNLEPSQKLRHKEIYLYRDVSGYIEDKGVSIRLVIDLYVGAQIKGTIERGELSFRVKSSHKDKTDVAIKLYSILKNFNLITRNYKTTDPEDYY